MLQRTVGPLILIITITTYANIAIACTPPEIPSCYSSRVASTHPSYSICRQQIRGYQDRGDSYLQCLLNDLNKAAGDADRAAQDYDRTAQDYKFKKMQYDTAANNLNRAVNRLNQANAEYEQANAEYQQHVQNYEEASKYIQDVLDAIIDNFNQMFGG